MLYEHFNDHLIISCNHSFDGILSNADITLRFPHFCISPVSPVFHSEVTTENRFTHDCCPVQNNHSVTHIPSVCCVFQPAFGRKKSFLLGNFPEASHDSYMCSQAFYLRKRSTMLFAHKECDYLSRWGWVDNIGWV